MGKQFKNIDDLYRSELGGTVTQAPDFVKANIDNQLGFSKRKRNYWLFGALAIVMISAASIFFLIPAGNTENVPLSLNGIGDKTNSTLISKLLQGDPTTTAEASNSSETVVVKNSEAVASPHTEQTNNNPSRFTNNDNATSSSTTNTRNTAVVPNTTSSSNNATDNRLVNTNSGPTNSATYVTTNTIDNSSVLSSNTRSTTVSDSPSDDSVNTINPLATHKVAQIDTTHSVNTSTTNTPLQNTNITDDLGAISADTNALVKTSDADPSPEEKTTDAPNQSIENTEDLPEPDPIDNEASSVTAPTNDSLTETAPPVILPKEESPYKPWMITATAGVNTVRSAYSAESVSDEMVYDLAMKERLGNQINLDFSYRLKNGWAFGSGLGLSNFQESYDFSTKKTIMTTKHDTIPVYDSTGTVIDTNYVPYVDTNTVYTNYNGINKVNYLTVPVQLGTQIIYKKFQFDIFALARFNFLMHSSGGYMLKNTFIPFNAANSIHKRFYVDLMLGTKAHYNFWKNLYVTGTVQYRPVVGTAYKDVKFNKTFDYVHYGLGLSIRL